MKETDLDNDTTRNSGKLTRVASAAILAVVLCAATYYWQRSGAIAAEQQAIGSLKAMRAIVVLDANRKHAESINLSTVPPPSFDDAIEHLAALHYARSVDLSRTKFNDAHCDAVSELKHIQSLVLTETPLTDQGIARLVPRLRDLEALYLVGTQVTPRSAKTLSDLPSLTILDLSRTSFDAGFDQIARLPRLEWLLLRENDLGSSDLMPLSQAKSLTRISLEGATVQPSSVDALRKAKTGLIIEAED